MMPTSKDHIMGLLLCFYGLLPLIPGQSNFSFLGVGITSLGIDITSQQPTPPDVVYKFSLYCPGPEAPRIKDLHFLESPFCANPHLQQLAIYELILILK